ncbi:structural maintenance of chromosomes flexible hinge domain-containing protein 1 [Brachyistius frenatus]|uniref:structural maintenance of chromosomes flexible hinge domain-containing protein 1 n=1 Tax=Brachyistius frenatus TaxID=100188 RepID=UPI0037E92858
MNCVPQPPPAAALQRGGDVKRIRVYDLRYDESITKEMTTTGLDFNGFLRLLHKEFGIRLYETFVLVTTDRTTLDFDKFKELPDGSTLYLLLQEHQVLSAATEEEISFTPHFDTLLLSGAHGYHNQDGKNSLPYTLAELIDNALSATAKNNGTRTIEIRLLFDETAGKPAVIVLDNGCGMTSKQLNNWAVYRLSKFARESSSFTSNQEDYVRPDPVPRSLNSDISFFGVGGKQAVFNIGNSARMISKPKGSPDVHELVLSKEEFEKKERNKEDVYSGIIKNRKPGDSSHVTKDDGRFLHALIAEEKGNESFTAVVITGVQPEHITHLKNDFDVWTRELAHIYHYYIHGVSGQHLESGSTRSDRLANIDIVVTLRERPLRPPRVINLREVKDDVQTLYITAAADTFEFRASTGPDSGSVEGIIRYHPFLYDRETYPDDPYAAQAPIDDDDGNDIDHEAVLQSHVRGKRPVFECFWNGRLIPYCKVFEFDWCSRPSKGSTLPLECFSRFSGVLFTDDRFTVNANKLNFIDLESKLQNKNTIFTTVVTGQKTSKRGNIQKEFMQWLLNCHEKHDKQVEFLGYKETITRTDLQTKKMQNPWATFSSIKCDGKTYKTGQRVKSQKTQPILYGTVARFLLYGHHDEDVFATGGQVELIREPKELYNQTKIIAISKIDKAATDEAIQTNINNDRAKLPEKLQFTWTEGHPWPQDAVRPSGTVFGPFNVNILNRNEQRLSRMPSSGQGAGTRLVIKRTIVLHGPNGDEEVDTSIANYSGTWGYSFKKFENLIDLGKYTLFLNTMTNDENNSTVFGGAQLPSFSLRFTIKEGPADSFSIGAVNSTLRVGVPFDIPLQMQDLYRHPTSPPTNLQPVLKCSGLELSFETVDSSRTKSTIKRVKALGKVLNYQQCKSYDLKVTLPGLKIDTQTIKISLLPGNPHSFHVMPAENPIKVENGKWAKFNVEVHDEAGNVTANPKQIVCCQVQGYPPVETDCSRTGCGELLTNPINMKIIKGQSQKLEVKFVMLNHKNVALVTKELKVEPSTRVFLMELCSQNGNEKLMLRNNEKIEWLAGGLLENLYYKLHDEAGREVPLTAQIASMIKVNWTNNVNLKDLVQGKLPDLQVSTQVQEERFYQVSYKDQSVSVSFNIVPRPDEPSQLQVTPLQSTVRLGETFPENIHLELLDQYNNVTKTLRSTCVNHMTVEAEGLDKAAIAFAWQESSSSVAVTGLRFQSGSLGPREMCFSYGDYETRVMVKVVAGVPAQLKLVSEPQQPLQVLNNHSISTPFLIQLCDEWGNPSPDLRVVVELRSSPSTLKVTAAVTSQPVNTEGKASFTITKLSGPKGYYQLEFRGSFNKKPIPGPSVNLTVVPDPNEPVSLLVEYDTTANFLAGGIFPVFLVTVVSDEGSPITTFNPAAVSMFLREVAPSGNTPQTGVELKCSKPMENERNDCFHFRGKEIPTTVGKHVIQFLLRIDGKNDLTSNEIPIDVVANQPVKLGPDSQPGTPVVFYSRDIASRTLVENMTLRITDVYGNAAGQDLDGRVVVSVKCSTGERNKSLPLFEGQTSTFQTSLVKGKAHIPRLAIMENSPGESSSTCILVFQPDAATLPTTLDPFELPFLFCNDAENQRKVSELTRKKDELINVVAKYDDNFKAFNELLELLIGNFQIVNEQVSDLRNRLHTCNVRIARPLCLQYIDTILSEKTAEVNAILPNRVCSIHDNFRGQQDVLGKVGRLALVHDAAAARVISWHMSGHMDCVVTKTTEAARRIYENTRGQQQVIPLDSIYLTPGNRSLPHIRNGRQLFQPRGNPVHAREHLVYPHDGVSCNIVFKTFLGDTILIDDLDSANSYRRAVVQNRMQCPTILTRQGDRVSSRGKFGGTQNKAPPINELKVFGAPYPPHYHTLNKEIDLLRQYRSAVKKLKESEKERDRHRNEMNAPEMKRKQQEMEEKKRELEEIERQLGVRPGKRRKLGDNSE